MAGAQPLQGFARAVIVRGHEGGREDQQQQATAAVGYVEGIAGRLFPLLLARDERGRLAGLHVGDQIASALHALGAAIRTHELQRAVEVTAAPRGDGLRQFLHLLGGELLQIRQTLQLSRIIDDEPMQPVDVASDARACILVRLQVGLVTGEQVAALAGLGIQQRGEQVLQCLRHLQRVSDGICRLGAAQQGLA